MNKVLLVLVAAVLLGSPVFAQSNDSTMMKADKAAADGSMMKADQPAAADGSMMKAAPGSAAPKMMVSDTDKQMAVDPMDASAYNLKGLGKQVMAFSSEAAAEKLAKTQSVVYYFAATWCPDCQATYKDIKANFAKIPASVTILFVNYDKASDLKKKYGATKQVRKGALISFIVQQFPALQPEYRKEQRSHKAYYVKIFEAVAVAYVSQRSGS